jgi:hypothetical protein
VSATKRYFSRLMQGHFSIFKESTRLVKCPRKASISNHNRLLTATDTSTIAPKQLHLRHIQSYALIASRTRRSPARDQAQADTPRATR